MFFLRRNARRVLRLCQKHQEINLKNFSEASIKPFVSFLNLKGDLSLNNFSRKLFSDKAYSNADIRNTINDDTNADPNKNEENTVDVAAITNNDPDLLHKYKVLQLEMEVMRQDGLNVPSVMFLKTEHWQDLLQQPSRSSRLKFLQYLFKVEKRRENEKRKREEMKKEREDNPYVREELKDGEIRYSLQDNNIFLRFYEGTMNHMYNNNLIQAMQFGQKVVIDCGYDQDMIKRENINCAKQIVLLFSENRLHKDPFDLHLCNVNYDLQLMKTLHRFIKTLHEPWFPLNLHKESYLDIFPKEQLVYLTPHCKEEMTTFDHNVVYIIGGLVDKTNNQPLSLAKAKKEGIKMLKFPLDRYLQWTGGSGKSLTLNHCISILLDFKVSSDWKYALRHVPRRKIVDPNETNIAPNIIKATDNLRYDRTDKIRTKRKWVPIDLSIDSVSKGHEKRTDKLVDVKKIIGNN